jgi:hypothetical protein
MGKTVPYEGYTIQSSPKCISDRKEWQLCIVISFEQPSGVKSREFSADAMYATQQEADIHGIAFGQRLIDGTVEAQIAPGLSLELRVYVPGLEWPLMIDGAHVQWVSGQIVGLAFFRIRQTEQQRLDEVITNLNPYRNENDAR